MFRRLNYNVIIIDTYSTIEAEIYGSSGNKRFKE
jgi:hypothetical protein